jgi:hypothetical protein
VVSDMTKYYGVLVSILWLFGSALTDMGIKTFCSSNSGNLLICSSHLVTTECLV